MKKLTNTLALAGLGLLSSPVFAAALEGQAEKQVAAQLQDRVVADALFSGEGGEYGHRRVDPTADQVVRYVLFIARGVLAGEEPQGDIETALTQGGYHRPRPAPKLSRAVGQEQDPLHDGRASRMESAQPRGASPPSRDRAAVIIIPSIFLLRVGSPT